MTSPFGTPPPRPPSRPPSPPSFSPPSSPPPPPPGYGSAPADGAPPPGYEAYTPNPTSGFRRAGFGERLGAWLLDLILYGILGTALATPGIVLALSGVSDCATLDGESVCPHGSPSSGALGGGLLLVAAAMILTFIIYIRALGRTGQTWGRRIVGVRVVGEMTGEPIGVGRALGRQFVESFISGQVFYLGYLWMLWDDNQQTWHDKVAESIVVKV